MPRAAARRPAICCPVRLRLRREKTCVPALQARKRLAIVPRAIDARACIHSRPFIFSQRQVPMRADAHVKLRPMFRARKSARGTPELPQRRARYHDAPATHQAKRSKSMPRPHPASYPLPARGPRVRAVEPGPWRRRGAAWVRGRGAVLNSSQVSCLRCRCSTTPACPSGLCVSASCLCRWALS